MSRSKPWILPAGKIEYLPHGQFAPPPVTWHPSYVVAGNQGRLDCRGVHHWKWGKAGGRIMKTCVRCPAFEGDGCLSS